MLITKQYLDEHKTSKGGYTRAQLHAIEVDWPPVKGWKKEVIGQQLTAEQAEAFEAGCEEFVPREWKK